MLALGLAFSPATALLLSVLMVHGIAPGPLLIKQNPDLIWGFMASMYVGNVFLLALNLPLVGLFTSILKVPTKILMPIITVITLTGAYALNNSVFDLVMVVAFGVFGFLLRKWGFDGTPLAVGLVIGPTVEQGLRQGLAITDGSPLAFVQRPLCGTLLALGGLILLGALVMHLVRRRASRLHPSPDGSAA
jgi:putative tricarboxylic transport membrane protein